MIEPTDAEIVALADETRTAEGGANGYILPISFCRAVLAKWGAPQPVVPVWSPASTPPKEEDDEVLVRMADGRCEIAWATYWHGSSNAFAQWTFRDPDEDEQPVEWMRIPKHCAAAPHPTQAQAGAVPQRFTKAQQERLYQNRPKDVGKGISLADWRRTVTFIEAAHGIKGGQHGTE